MYSSYINVKLYSSDVLLLCFPDSRPNQKQTNNMCWSRLINTQKILCLPMGSGPPTIKNLLTVYGTAVTIFICCK